MVFNYCYVSSACNPIPTIADWGKNNLICYGACNSVLIYDLTVGGGKVIHCLVNHTKKVNSVKWMSSSDVSYETELLSASTDGTAIMWTWTDKNYKPCILKGHKRSVSIIDGFYRSKCKQNAVIVTASMDSTIRIWNRKNPDGEVQETQCINLNYSISMSLKTCILPETDRLLIVSGLENNKIAMYIQEDSPGSLNFIPSGSLEGHENWVRGLDFKTDENGDLLLASASQDASVRLWRFSRNTSDENKLKSKSVIKTNKINYTITLESILLGHEGWVFSANWSPDSLKLLTASFDKTMIIWEFDPDTGLWLENIRVGEVGGGTLGFYGGTFGPTEKHILAYSYHGAFHIWKLNEETDMWDPCVAFGGHFNEVVDLAWDPQGKYLITTSADQTTRIHAPWKKPFTNVETWHEIARPQVHGYDLSSIALLSRYKFVSSAEEKVIRVFEAPENFISNFNRICSLNEDENIKLSAPKGASLPSLGLSNKAVFDNDNYAQAQPKNKEMYAEESYFSVVELTEPPTEETLIQNTLWPEVHKLYGHGYEVFSLAASPSGDVVASACKSSTQEHASILIWETKTWQQIDRLVSHTLTVVQISFSPDSRHLLSVSRDRRWSLFKKNTKTGKFDLEATTDKKTGVHQRIIWCCSWTHDSKYFATGSRDGKVVIWIKNQEKETQNGDYIGLFEPCILDLKGQSVTALCFAPTLVSDSYLLAIGLESGSIIFYLWDMRWSELTGLHNRTTHHLTVKRLAFRPLEACPERVLTLASCSSDFSVKMFNIDVNDIIRELK